MAARYGCFKLSPWMVFVGLMGLSVEAAPLRQTRPDHDFLVTERGVQLQQRGGVPLSGAVLYAPVPMEHGFSLPLDDAGPNVRCNQDALGARQNEIAASANPLNTDIVLTGSNDYRNGDASGGFYRSTDGATSFSDALVTRGPAGVFDAAGDPVAAVDNTGRMYATYIAFDRSTPDNGLYVQTSLDNGTTWSGPAVVAAHTGGGAADFEDKPYACCDYSFGSPYLGNFYVTWTRFFDVGGAQIHFSKSENGGASFTAPLAISGSMNAQFSCPTVGPNGEIYVVWYTYGSVTIRFDYSLDGGSTWHLDRAIAPFNDNFPQNPCGTWRIVSYPVVGCDVSVGPRRGWIYVSWVDNSGGEPDVLFTRSEDGGTTWTAPVHVEDDATDHWQWFHWMTVNPGTGDIGISWLDRREDPAGCLYRTYATVSTDGGNTWSSNFPVSDVASDPTAPTFIGDYNANTFKSDGFYAGWVDLRNDNGDAYAAWYRLALPAPEALTLYPAGDDVVLRWHSASAPFYNIYSAASPDGPFDTLEGTTTDTVFVDVNPGVLAKFYTVRAATE